MSAAWLMATCPDERFRDNDRAVAAAKKAIELDGGEDYRYLDTLAAAHASAGKFDDAKSIMEEVIKIAPDEAKERLKKRLAIYEEGKPYREAPRVVVRPPGTRSR
jgi:tetratricopeptide (TPR) repeat protein